MATRYWDYLQECLRTGDFGPVRLDMTREEVRACLGEPDDMGGVSRKHRTPTVWKYGEVELHFEPFSSTGKLFQIFWDDLDGNWIVFNTQGGRVGHGDDEG